MFHLQLKSPGSPRAQSLPAFTVLLHIWVTGEGLCRIGPLADIYGPASPGFDDQDGRALGQWGVRPGASGAWGRRAAEVSAARAFREEAGIRWDRSGNWPRSAE